MGIHRIKILDAVLADSEADVEATYTCNGGDSRALCDLNKGILLLTAGTETGTATFVVDTVQACYDVGDATTWVSIETSISKTVSAAGTQTFTLAGTYGQPHYLKLLISSVTLTGSHYFATFTAELQFSTNSCCG